MTVGELKKILDKYSDNCKVESTNWGDEFEHDNINDNSSNFMLSIQIRNTKFVKDNQLFEKCKNCTKKNNKWVYDPCNHCEFNTHRDNHYAIVNNNKKDTSVYYGYKILTDSPDNACNYFNTYSDSIENALKEFNEERDFYLIDGNPIKIIEYDEDGYEKSFNLIDNGDLKNE